MSDCRRAARSLTNTQLVSALSRLVREDRRLTAELLAHIAEVDARKLYLEQACSSMHVYCVERLRMSDQQAYRRIHAARAARKFSVIFGMVERNELTVELEAVRENTMMNFFDMFFPSTDRGPDIAAMGAIIGAGVSYLVSRGRQINIYNGVDLQSEAGWRRLP